MTTERAADGGLATDGEAPASDTTYSFVLFVTGQTRRSERASTNLERLCEERLGAGNFEIDVVDVLEDPHRAEEERIIATPTVIRTRPIPRRRVIGDLAAADQAALALDFPYPS